MKAFRWLVVAVVALASVIVARTLLLTSRQPDYPPAALLTVDADAAAARFAGALAIPTISHRPAAPGAVAEFDARAFVDLHAYLAASYPLVHRTLGREIINDYSLLYRWRGTDGGLAPALLMGHMDVVPIEPGTEDAWTHPPFAGDIADGYIWGRGALDDKASVVATLEAAEKLIASGFKPERTVYFAFGHDEEKGGFEGARKIAGLLAERGIKFAFLLDEGQPMTVGLIPGIERPVAAIALAEKGSVYVELRARAQGGHPARPPKDTAVGALSRAVAALEARRMPATLGGTFGLMFDDLAPEMGFYERMMFANEWLFAGPLIARMERSPQMNATMRTTTAVTYFEGGIPNGGLPSSARARFRFSVRPGDTPDGVLEHIRAVVDDPAIEIEVLRPPRGATPVSAIDTRHFEAIRRAAKEVFPDVLVSPGQALGGQDARHFLDITENAYRLVPVLLGPDDMSRPHGTNERIPVDNYARVIQFFGQLIRNAAGPGQ